MPCNSDYLNPTQEEKNKKIVSRLLVYVNDKLEQETEPLVRAAALDYYGGDVNLSEIVARLCQKIRAMSKRKREAIVYNAHDPVSRELASWWEQHQEADRKREANQ